MKKYNKILEAINRGINLALDDFEDEEIVNLTNSSKVEVTSNLKNLVDVKKVAVDLGLPSGTLWCKYNLDVDPNLLSNAEDWYGKYYAWGELEGNKTKRNEIYFDWDNYKFGKNRRLSKYCNNPNYGLNYFTDNLTKLLPEDDVAYLNKKLYNFKFHIPTKELVDELIKYTKNYWVNNYDPNKTVHNPKDDGGIKGLNGRVFKGKNRNQLFIPAAGGRYGFNIGSVGYWCYLWSSNLYLDDANRAYYLYFYSDTIALNHSRRDVGYSIRPVINL